MLVVVAVILAVAAFAQGAVLGAHHHPPRPSVTVDAIGYFGLPHPYYIALGHSGFVPGFVVRVHVFNHGSRPVDVRHVDLSLESMDVPKVTARLRVVRPGIVHAHSARWVSAHVAGGDIQHLSLGRWRVATTTWADQITFAKGPEIVVIAREWDVDNFTTETTPYGAAPDYRTSAADGFYFRLSRYDAASRHFVYAPTGGVSSGVSGSASSCTWTGSIEVPSRSWANSSLWIALNLRQYDAKVIMAGTPTFSVTETCNGVSFPWSNANPADLVTYAGIRALPTMTPTMTTLTGSDGDANLHTTWAWTFSANVP